MYLNWILAVHCPKTKHIFYNRQIVLNAALRPLCVCLSFLSPEELFSSPLLEPHMSIPCGISAVIEILSDVIAANLHIQIMLLLF